MASIYRYYDFLIHIIKNICNNYIKKERKKKKQDIHIVKQTRHSIFKLINNTQNAN